MVRFESTLLPQYAEDIDLLGMYGLLPQISDEASLWLWRFCVGCSSEINQGAVITCMCDEVIELLRRNADYLAGRVPEFIAGDDPRHVISCWESALEKILELARGKDRCVWEIMRSPVLPADGGGVGTDKNGT
ncbi:MAG: hypothetical protein V4710_12825 [Verrucomicrobiota bacterium]